MTNPNARPGGWWSGPTPTCLRCLAAIADLGTRWDCAWRGYAEPIVAVDHRLAAYRERRAAGSGVSCGKEAERRRAAAVIDASWIRVDGQVVADAG